jgi:hypothetical protein
VSDSPFSDETLWRVVGLLAHRPENTGKALEELVALATRTILRARQIAHTEENNFFLFGGRLVHLVDVPGQESQFVEVTPEYLADYVVPSSELFSLPLLDLAARLVLPSVSWLRVPRNSRKSDAGSDLSNATSSIARAEPPLLL